MYFFLFYFILMIYGSYFCYIFFFFNDTATTEIYTLSLHDALPIFSTRTSPSRPYVWTPLPFCRSEEHTSELQSRENLVCRLLLEKKKKYHASVLLSRYHSHHTIIHRHSEPH